MSASSLDQHKKRKERLMELALTLTLGDAEAHRVIPCCSRERPEMPALEASGVMEELSALVAQESQFVANCLVYIDTQGLVRSANDRRRFRAMQRGYDKFRNDTFREMVRTEREFVSKLKIVVDAYMMPLKKSLETKQPIVSQADVKTLFGPVEGVLLVHEAILSLLTQIEEHWPDVRGVGELFLTIAAKLGIYGEYVRNCPAAVKTCIRLEESNARFSEFLQGVASKRAGLLCGVGLVDFLPVPLNQITQYEHFLQTLVDHTTAAKHGAQEVDSLQKAFALVKHVNSVVQVSYEMSHNRQRVVEVQETLGGTKLLEGGSPDRRFVSEREVVIVTKKGIGKKQHNRRMYLFSDIILFTKEGHVHESTKLEGAKVEPEEGSDLAILFTAPHLSCTILLPTAPEKGQLLSALTKLLSGAQNANMVFGNDLMSLLKKEDRLNTIPIVVEKICNYLLLPPNISTEGIFRMAGSQTHVSEWKKRIDNGWTPEIDDILAKNKDTVTIAQVLKIYFREMPEPLFSSAHYDTWMSLAAMSGNLADDQFVAKVMAIVAQLPLAHQNLLKYLMQFLYKVSLSSDQNFMTARNLSLMFAPNILRPKLETVESSLSLPRASEIVHRMIEVAPLLVSPLPPRGTDKKK